MDSLLILLFSVLSVVLVLWLSSHTRDPLPPGPSPVPILGNILGVNPEEPWVSYTRWARIYGDLFYCRLLNQEVIVINSEEVAKELLERRSYNYSDRPAITRLVNDFIGWSFNSVMLPYCDRWRLHRRIFHRAFRPQAALAYRPIQLQKARDLALNLFETPENFFTHVQTHSISIIMEVVYGYETVRRDDPLVNVVQRAIAVAVASIRPEVAAFLGYFPFVRYIPAWFPGASFKRDAILSQTYVVDMVQTPFHFAQESMAAGTATSMVSNSLSRVQKQDLSDEYMLAVKESAATAFTAGSETTSSTLLIFVLVMLLHPDAQMRAQAEIDSVVGTARLPVFEDRPSLPYVDAVLRETLRWRPAVPLVIPHATTSTDIYGGYFIPQGAAVIMNTWAMTRNESKYPNPERFQPERFLRETGELTDDAVDYAFGAGRRFCVGRHFGDASLWSAIVTILAIFRITPCKDERGNDVDVEPQWTAGVTSHPHRFPCQFVPRASGLSAEKLAQMF